MANPKAEDIIRGGIYGITAERYSLGRSNVQVAREMIEAGIRIIQYREKDKSMLSQFSECLELRQMTKAANVAFIVNDHVDLALLVEADGVHLGQDDLPVEAVRRLVGREMIIGLSTHSPEQAQAALRAEVDYIGVGPLYPTSTKDGVCAPVGLGYLEYVVANIALPFVAIGGIKEHNISEVKKRGASCICLVTEIVGADNIKAKVHRLLEIINCP